MFIMEHFSEGGWGMWPILLLAIITIYIAVDRFTYLGKSKVDVDKLMLELAQVRRRGYSVTVDELEQGLTALSVGRPILLTSKEMAVVARQFEDYGRQPRSAARLRWALP